MAKSFGMCADKSNYPGIRAVLPNRFNPHRLIEERSNNKKAGFE